MNGAVVVHWSHPPIDDLRRPRIRAEHVNQLRHDGVLTVKVGPLDNPHPREILNAVEQVAP